METITYAIFNESYNEAACFKQRIRQFSNEEGALDCHFRADTCDMLMESLASEQRTGRLPRILLMCYPFHNDDSKNIIAGVKQAFPEIKILLITKSKDKKKHVAAFRQKANGVIYPARRLDELALQVVASCRKLMHKEHLNNEYFEYYVKQLESTENFIVPNDYSPPKEHLEIAEMLRDGYTETEIAKFRKQSIDHIKHEVGKMYDGSGIEKRRIAPLAFWFVNGGYIANINEAA